MERVLAAYDHRARRGAELVGGEIAERLEELIGAQASARAGTLGVLSVEDLLEPVQTPPLPEPAPPSTIPASRTVGQ